MKSRKAEALTLYEADKLQGGERETSICLREYYLNLIEIIQFLD